VAAPVSIAAVPREPTRRVAIAGLLVVGVKRVASLCFLGLELEELGGTMRTIANPFARVLLGALTVACFALSSGARAQEVTAETLVDRLQIQDLITRYYNNFGRENAENFADFYAEDAELIDTTKLAPEAVADRIVALVQRARAASGQ